jgi:hypothetical protein
VAAPPSPSTRSGSRPREDGRGGRGRRRKIVPDAWPASPWLKTHPPPRRIAEPAPSETAAAVFQLYDGQTDRTGAAVLSRDHGLPSDTAVVDLALSELRDAGLITDDQEAEEGINRSSIAVDRLDEVAARRKFGPSGRRRVAAAETGPDPPGLIRGRPAQPPKSFDDSEGNPDDLSEPNPLLD